jgi:hypothetical protein
MYRVNAYNYSTRKYEVAGAVIPQAQRNSTVTVIISNPTSENPKEQ